MCAVCFSFDISNYIDTQRQLPNMAQGIRCDAFIRFINPEGNFWFRQLIAVNVFQTIIGFQP